MLSEEFRMLGPAKWADNQGCKYVKLLRISCVSCVCVFPFFFSFNFFLIWDPYVLQVVSSFKWFCIFSSSM